MRSKILSFFIPFYLFLKIKNFKKEIFIVGGFVENAHKASLLLGEYRGKRFHFVGKVSVMRDSPLYKSFVRIPVS